MRRIARRPHRLLLHPASLVLGVLVVLSVFGGVVAPHNPLAQDSTNIFAGSSWSHLLGTDPLGRDTLSRLIVGTRVSLLSAAAAVLIGFVGGGIPGMASVFLARPVEYVLKRVTDALMMLPPVIFAIAVVGAFGNGLTPAIVAIGILMTPRFFRIVRAETLGLVHSQYVEAAVLLGASRTQVLRRHVWRKIVPTAIVTIATGIGYTVLAISSLSFLGLGVIAPAPSWGSMLTVDLQYLYQAPLAALWPGLAIVITVWACNALADATRSQPRAVKARSRVTTRVTSEGRVGFEQRPDAVTAALERSV